MRSSFLMYEKHGNISLNEWSFNFQISKFQRKLDCMFFLQAGANHDFILKRKYQVDRQW